MGKIKDTCVSVSLDLNSAVRLVLVQDLNLQDVGLGRWAFSWVP